MTAEEISGSPGFMQQSNGLQRECEALRGPRDLESCLHSVEDTPQVQFGSSHAARDQQPRAIVEQLASVASRGRPWRFATATNPNPAVSLVTCFMNA